MRFGYDETARIASWTDRNDTTYRYFYDELGRVTRTEGTSLINSLRQTIHYDRDELGQITRKDADGEVTTFAYDRTDQLVQAVSPDAAVTFVRSSVGLLLSETVNGRTVGTTPRDAVSPSSVSPRRGDRPRTDDLHLGGSPRGGVCGEGPARGCGEGRA
ncbi:hypothetical protein [Streptomyces venezuelae]|uniref:hypothetical protein n=1 Tax=Streptomyces venezuelae TaxID=54571 RepID=UPI00378A6246